MTDQETLEAGSFFRQRRNLLIVCTILFVQELAKIEISAANIAGLNFKIGDPEALNLFLWSIFFYFLIRYLQYYRAFGANRFKYQLSSYLNTHCRPIIEEQMKQLGSIRSHNLNSLNFYGELAKNQWIIGYSCQGDEEFKPPNYPRQMKVSRWRLRNEIMKAWIDIIFLKNDFTDYLLPFFIAVFVLLYCKREIFLHFF